MVDSRSHELKVAVVGGFGLMASPMSRHLRGQPNIKIVAVHDRGGLDERRQQIRKAWSESGATLVSKLEQLFDFGKLDGVFVCCGKDGDDRDIVNELVELLSSNCGQGFICHLSTISVAFAELVSGFAASRGIQYVNYPLTGGPKGAESASMLILASGPEEIYQRLEPLLSKIGKPRYFGEGIGLAASVKLIGHLSVFFGLLGVSSAAALQSEIFEGGKIGSTSQVEFFDFLNAGAGHTRQWDLSLRRGIHDQVWNDGFHIKYAVVDAIYLMQLLVEKKVSRIILDCVARISLIFAYVIRKHDLSMATHAMMRELISDNSDQLDKFVAESLAGAYTKQEVITACIGALPVSIKRSLGDLVLELQEVG